jgi:hypothetical protein
LRSSDWVADVDGFVIPGFPVGRGSVDCRERALEGQHRASIDLGTHRALDVDPHRLQCDARRIDRYAAGADRQRDLLRRLEAAAAKADIEDHHRSVEHDDDLKVGNDQTITIHNNRTETVEQGNASIEP